MITKIMIPVAAFAITVTSAAAFSTASWSQPGLDLTDSQIEAREEAREIRQTARTESRQMLEGVGLDRGKMQELHQAQRAVRQIEREAVQAALADEDYDAFVAAVVDTPLAEAIDSEANFERFLEAHVLLEAGEYEAAQEIMSDLGLEGRGGMMGGRGHGVQGGMRDGFGGQGMKDGRGGAGFSRG